LAAFKSRSFIFILVISLITLLIYYPGLFGDYVFDDIPNILENEKLKLENLNKNELLSAFGSGDAGPLGRPISMLSFALNYYVTGFNPFYFKITNLFIHLLNGILVYFIVCKIFQRILINKKEKNIILLSGIVSLIWLVHPVNLTSVLYVVQRMTSLSALFGFIAVLLYCHWRSLISQEIIHSLFIVFAIIFSLVCAAYSKESGLLFIPLIFLIELCVYQGKNKKLEDIRIFNIKLIYILWSLCCTSFIFIVYIGYLYVVGSQPGNRDFNIAERLLTESRVIFYYLKLIFYPLLSELSLYHDNFTISKNIFEPITTLYSVLGIITFSLLSIIFYKKNPLILFAWGWFIISHLMESSFISLELVHEHRNYFSFVGFVIVIVYYLSQIKSIKVKPFIYMFAVLFVGNLALTTWQRAMIWSNLVEHAAFEAEMKPDSDRANYQMARIYIKLMNNDPEKKDEYAQMALNFMKKAQNSYRPANGGWFGEIHLNAYLNISTSQETIDTLIDNLKNRPFYNSNINFISNFMECQVQGYCNIPHDQAILIISSALENKGATLEFKSEIYKILAQYFVGAAGDYIKGEEFVKDALSYEKNIDGYLLLSQIYRLQGKLIEAKESIALAKSSDKNGIWFKEIAIEQRKIAQASS
jgi:tetratricopeptide (TPR) repeat protein